MVQTTRNIELFDKTNKKKTKKKNQTNKQTNNQKKKKSFIQTIFDKALMPFWKTFL